MKTPDYVSGDREEFLKRMLKSEPYTITFLGYEIVIFPQVFLPSTASEAIAKFMQVRKGTRIIDIGTGAGILALIAGLKGGVGYAIDINPNAVKNARLNLEKYSIVGIQTIESDLFSNIPSETFDLITFNRPFWDSYDDKIMEHVVELGFSDPTGKVLHNFLDQSRSYLNKNGIILISAAEWEDLSQVEMMFRQFGYTYKILGKLASRRDERRVYRVYKLVR